MTSTQQWEQVRRDYLNKIEKALTGAAESERRQILNDVTVHLDRRFAELTAEEQTWENMQHIITEMGPAEDYAELLEEKPATEKRRRSAAVYWMAGLIILLVIASFVGTYWKGCKESQETIWPMAGFIIHFAPAGDFAPVTPRELLDAFNLNHPQGVSTWYFRTEPKDSKLLGSIFTPTQNEANLLKKMVDDHPRLKLLRVQQVTTAELEIHKAKKQLSLPRE